MIKHVNMGFKGSSSVLSWFDCTPTFLSFESKSQYAFMQELLAVQALELHSNCAFQASDTLLAYFAGLPKVGQR